MFLEHASNAEFLILTSAEAEEAERNRKHVFEVCNAKLKFEGEVQDFCKGITNVVFCQTQCTRKDECYEIFNEWCRLGNEDPKSKILELARLERRFLNLSKEFKEELEIKKSALKEKYQSSLEGFKSESSQIQKEGRLF